MGFDGHDEARARLEHLEALKGDPVPSLLLDVFAQICHRGTGNIFLPERVCAPSALVGSLLEHRTRCPLLPLAPAAPLSLLPALRGGMLPLWFLPIPRAGAWSSQTVSHRAAPRGDSSQRGLAMWRDAMQRQGLTIP